MARYDFCINQGADILLPILLKDSSDSVIKLNGFKVRMQIRQYKHSETAIDTLTTSGSRRRKVHSQVSKQSDISISCSQGCIRY